MTSSDRTAVAENLAALPKRSLCNLGWMVGGRVIRLAISLSVTAWVARYLAPGDFGELSYLMSIVAMLAALCGCGLDGLVVRELVNRRWCAGTILGTSFGLRLGSGGMLYLVLVAGWWLHGGSGRNLAMIALLGTDLLFQASGVFDLHFQARTRNKWTVLASTLSLVAASTFRLILIQMGASLEAFAAAVLLESALSASFLGYFHRRQRMSLEGWRFESECALRLLAESWPMVVSAVSIAGAMRLDQVMLRSLSGEAAVGVYAVAVRLGEVWYFLPMFLGTTLNPWIVEGRALGRAVYEQRLVRLYALTIWSACGTATALALTANPMVRWLFGESYVEAVRPLQIHLVGGVLLAVGIAAGKWYVAESLTAGLMRKALLGLSLNLLGNFLLIPRYGASGAAMAAVAGQVGANVIYDLVDAQVRPQLTLKLRALAPWTFLRS